jgi:GMP synthase (glutamine-hydrolysing)
MRQPFPGPGLGIRIIGEVTPEKVKIVQEADAIYREEMDKAGMQSAHLGQYFAALTNMRSPSASWAISGHTTTRSRSAPCARLIS